MDDLKDCNVRRHVLRGAKKGATSDHARFRKRKGSLALIRLVEKFLFPWIMYKTSRRFSRPKTLNPNSRT